MKKILSTLITILTIVLPPHLSAQTDKDLLIDLVKQQAKLSEQVAEISKQQTKFSEQMAETNKQIVEIAKQQAVVSTEIKGVDKRLDQQSIYIISIMGLFGVLIAVIVWDRRTFVKPFETKTDDLKKKWIL